MRLLIIPWRRRAREHDVVVTCGMTAVIASILLTYCALKFGLNTPPSATGDEPSYDSIGWELSHGGGFSSDFRNPDFREPYELAAQTDPSLMTLPEIAPGTTAYRPPLFPGMIAMTDLLFGRQFWAFRSLNVIAMAAVGGMLFQHLVRSHGFATAVVGITLFLFVDVRTRLYARTILTEPLATLLTTVLILLVLRLRKTQHLRDAVLVGIIDGLAILTRSAFALWLPGLTVLLLGLLLTATPSPGFPAPQNQSFGARFRRAGLLTMTVLGIAMAVYLPWGLRNCLLTNRFMPLGTQGAAEMSAAFSDLAWQNGGVWFNQEQEGFYASLNESGKSRIECELLRADLSRGLAKDWLSRHPGKALLLGLTKIYHEYRPRAGTEWIISLTAVCGVIFSWSHPDTRVLVLFHVVNATAIAVSWSVEGRFVVPLLFSIHVLAAIGVMTIARWMLDHTFGGFSPRLSNLPAE